MRNGVFISERFFPWIASAMHLMFPRSKEIKAISSKQALEILNIEVLSKESIIMRRFDDFLLLL